MKNISLLIILGLLSAGMMGCGASTQHSGGIQLEPQPAGPMPPAPPPEPGSLWTTRSSQGLLTDHRARAVGDILTVTVTEESRASNSAQTQADKATGLKAGVESLFGIYQPMNAFSDNSQVAADVISTRVGNTMKGTGKTERQSTVIGFIQAQVVQLLPNGNLAIRGNRNVRINNETQIMTITGIVRPKDINQYNQVASNQVAEARMEITGIGVVADKQRQGWFTRLFDHIWPF